MTLLFTRSAVCSALVFDFFIPFYTLMNFKLSAIYVETDIWRCFVLFEGGTRTMRRGSFCVDSYVRLNSLVMCVFELRTLGNQFSGWKRKHVRSAERSIRGLQNERRYKTRFG